MRSGSRGASPDASVDAARIEAVLLELVTRRGVERSACPSEVARALAPDGSAWRTQMEPVREVARALARDGRIEILQRGQRVSPDRPTRGPIRLRVVAWARGVGSTD